MSRAAVQKQIDRLERMGLPLERVARRGYRLSEPLAPLDAPALLAELDPECLGGLPLDLATLAGRLEIHETLDSTSSYLMARMQEDPAPGRVCLAEEQTAGRGRRGRSWIASPYRNLLMSVSWVMTNGPRACGGLSLAGGVCVAGALKEAGLAEVQLKWPNDILCRGRKLGGLLLDIAGESDGPSIVVLGIGINVALGRAGGGIDQPWTDMRAELGGGVNRNRLAALVLGSVLAGLARFEREGFGAFRDGWQRLDVCRQREVSVHTPGGPLRGRALGVNADGALLLETPAGGLRTVYAGEVSLRLHGGGGGAA